MSRGGALEKLKTALARVGIKAPWAYTGPVSSPEYLSHLPRASDYRRVAPASQIRAAVPQAEPQLVYDIKYYVRDTRRAHLPGGSIKLERGTYDVKAKEEALEAAQVAPTPGSTHKWKPLRNILDNPNGGYTL